MAAIKDMVDDVLGAVYGAPRVVVMRALQRAAQELCKSSHCWRERLENIESERGEYAYAIPTPYGAVADRLIWVKFDGRRLMTQMRPESVMAFDDAVGAPTCYAQDASTQEVYIWPAPDTDHAGKQIQVMAVLSPTLQAAEIPDGIMDEYRQGIVARAKADLMLGSPESTWYNPNAAMAQMAVADEVFSRAKRAQHSGHSMPLTVSPRKFI